MNAFKDNLFIQRGLIIKEVDNDIGSQLILKGVYLNHLKYIFDILDSKEELLVDNEDIRVDSQLSYEELMYELEELLKEIQYYSSKFTLEEYQRVILPKIEEYHLFQALKEYQSTIK